MKAKGASIAGNDTDRSICDLNDIGVEHCPLLLHSIAVCRYGRRDRIDPRASRGERGEAVTVRLSTPRAVYLSPLTQGGLLSHPTLVDSGLSASGAGHYSR